MALGTIEIGTIGLVLTTIGILYLIWRLRMRNIANLDEEPKIAGSDQLSGGAIDSEQFDEPDDNALDEMHDLLEQAAESQGLTYEE